MTMRFTIDKAAFAARLVTAARVSSRGQSVYRSLVLSAIEGELMILATDGSVEFCGTAPATVAEQGEASVCGKFLHSLVKCLPAGILSLETDGMGNLVLRSGQLEYTLATDPAWDTESLSDAPAEGGQDVVGAQLCEAIDRVLFCVGRDQSMEGISCLKLDPDGDAVAMVGLDGHLLARTLIQDSTLRTLLQAPGLLLHRSYVEDLRRWLPQGSVQVAVSEKRLHLRTLEETFSLPLSAFEYPRYKDFLTKAETAASRLEAGREALLAALERLDLFTTAMQRGAIVQATAMLVTLSAQADQGQAKEVLVAEFAGVPVRVVLPVKALSEILHNLVSERVRLDICGRDTPCLITGLDDADADYALILMPLVGDTE